MAITTAQAATIITHTIQGKETIPMLAKKYCTTKADIEQRNSLQPNKYVQRGTQLKIAMNTVSKKKNIHGEVVTIAKVSTKKLRTLDEIRKSRQAELSKKGLNKKIYASKNNVKELQSETVTIAKVSTKKLRTLDEIRKSRQEELSHSPKAVKHIVRKRIVAAKKTKTHTLKSKLLATLKKHKKRFKPQKDTPKRVTVNDITFKSSRSSVSNKNNKDVNKIINLAKQKLGRKYVWGAVGKRGTFDCSGFTSYVYKKIGIHIPRTSRNQAKYGKYIARNNLKKGDLIFFDTSKHRKGYVNHVGIYLGNGKFIHASSAQKKVVVSNLSKFYAQRYVGARRPS